MSTKQSPASEEVRRTTPIENLTRTMAGDYITNKILTGCDT